VPQGDAATLHDGRARAGPAPRDRPRRIRAALRAHRSLACAGALFLAFSAAVTLTDGEGAAWILMTSPVERSHRVNSLLGYTVLLGGAPLHKENVCSFDLLMLFRGVSAPLDWRAVRSVYPFAASVLFPLASPATALALTVWLSWAAAALVAARFAWRLAPGTPAPALAVVLATGGMGMLAHAADYGAHLMSFTFYWLGVLALLESEVWRRARPLRVHLGLGALMAVACLQYNTGLVLGLGSLLVSLRHNRTPHVLAGASLWLTAQPVWQWTLNRLRGAADAAAQPFYPVEGSFLRESLGAWGRLVVESPPAAAAALAGRLGEFAFFDSPLVVAGGLLALPFVFRSRAERWFALVLGALPLGAALAFSQSAASRGHPVYGISVFFHAALAVVLARGWRRRGALRSLAAAATLAVVASHFWWSTAYRRGNLGPLKAYYLGLDDAAPLMRRPPAVVSSLTGEEPVPAAFGGAARLVDAGALVTPATQPARARPALAVVGGAVPAAYLVLMAATLGRTRRGRAAAAAAAAAAALSSALLGSRLTLAQPAVFPFDRAITLSEGEELTYRLHLAPGVRQALARHAPVAERAYFHLALSPPRGAPPRVHGCQVRMIAGGRELAVRPHVEHLWSVNSARLAAAAAASPDFVVKVVAPRACDLQGWQRASLPGRAVETSRGQSPAVVPALELRLVRPDGSLELAAF
jgi:hypothetical protein